MTDPGKLGVHPDVADAIKAAASELMNAGYTVEEREAPMRRRATEIHTQIMDNFSRASARQLPPSWHVLDRLRAVLGGVHPAMEGGGRRRQTRSDDGARDDCASLGRSHGRDAVDSGAHRNGARPEGWRRPEIGFGTEWLRAVVVVNLLGLPSVAVPIGVANGVPQVVQIIGPRFLEDLCLAAAEAIEDRSPRLTPIDPR